MHHHQIAESAVLLINGFNPDEYWIGPKGEIFSVDGDVQVNDSAEFLVNRQIEMALSIGLEDLKTFVDVAYMLREGMR